MFRSLSYFRDYEDSQIRGDEFEGTRSYQPQNGLEATLTETGEKKILPHSFESTANGDDIFVFCLSTAFSDELATQFKTDTCVEITDPAKLIAGIRAALERRSSIKDKFLVHGNVKYYTHVEPPMIDWALPERIAMSKLNIYESQQEYRFAFAVNEAFKVENTCLRLVSPGERSISRTTSHPERLLKIGNLTKICRVHRFG